MTEEGEIIRRFLESPFDRRCFDAFFKLCYSSTLGFLRYYGSRGYPLPIERADRESAVSDLALTLLGELFRSEHDKPFFPIFDYFERHGMKDFRAVSGLALYQHFRILLGGYLKKRLFHLRKSEQRQSEILKRRIKDILQPPDYIRFPDDITGQINVTQALYGNDLRRDKQPIQRNMLQDTVSKTFAAAVNRVIWCEEIFSEINEIASVQNYLKMNLLLELMVTVNGEALQELCPKPPTPLPPDLGDIENGIRQAIEETVAWAEEEVLADLVTSGKIPADDSELYLLAVERYLLDLGMCGEADNLPVYFREVMPEERHGDYRDRYRYAFQTIILKSVDHFRSQLTQGIP